MTDPTATSLVMPSRGVWEASREGVPIGTVTRLAGRYVAVGFDGAPLGDYSDLSMALDAVDEGRRQRRWLGTPRRTRAE